MNAPVESDCPSCKDGIGCEECHGRGTREGWRYGRAQKAARHLYEARLLLGTAEMAEAMRAVDAARDMLRPAIAKAREPSVTETIDAANDRSARRAYQMHGRRR